MVLTADLGSEERRRWGEGTGAPVIPAENGTLLEGGGTEGCTQKTDQM